MMMKLSWRLFPIEGFTFLIRGRLLRRHALSDYTRQSLWTWVSSSVTAHLRGRRGSYVVCRILVRTSTRVPSVGTTEESLWTLPTNFHKSPDLRPLLVTVVTLYHFDGFTGVKMSPTLLTFIIVISITNNS